jgi:2-oxoglutarate dehydrogenase E2 component (dihydrolipoamide succinyltransferase)
MGESIAEGTIVRWIKKVGDRVDRDEPLLEISTDKVDAEIPAPVAGVLIEIKVAEGETVPVNSVVGTIGPEGFGARDPGSGTRPAAPEPRGGDLPVSPKPRSGEGGGLDVPPSGSLATGSTPAGEDSEGQRTSPLVRKMAKEHGVDISRIQGTGAGGRVTKADVQRVLDAKGVQETAAASSQAGVERPAAGDERVEIQPLSIMRRKIAEHMLLSQQTSAHVHSVFHVGFAQVDRIREQKKQEYERRGVKLTYLSFIASAVATTLRRHPLINASLDGNNIVLRKDINLGIAVAIEGGLIVPVVRNADAQDMPALCRAIADVAERARTKQLKPDEVHGGTFTITNPGQFGAQFGMPIINQPQVAILGIGTIEKRPVVVDDAIAVRRMAYLTLGYDHRLIDGATADQFMADVKQAIEQFDETIV